ncbi:MAG TPA: trypsin-like peptidase domain-containing protein [bacterium]|jgi:serine protease Do
MKVLNFFAIGLIFGGLFFYQFHRNQQLEQEIDVLRGFATGSQVARAHLASGAGTDAPKTFSTDDPKAHDVTAELSGSRSNAITRAVANTSGAVVGINVVQLREVRNPYRPVDPLGWMMFDERLWPPTIKQKVQNLGSGFIISPDGYIVTNEHVVRDAAQVFVTTTTRNKYPAKVVGTDPLLDMALLKIDAKNLPCIPLGDSQDVLVGEWAIALGNPYGLFDINDQPSVSVGVISAVHRDFQSAIDGRVYTDMIQTDAAINPGNSGGPLLNADGVAVGMNTMIFSQSGGSVGIGFAIPSNRITATIDDLLKGGVNRKFWVGIRALDLSPTYARLQGLANNHGAVVTSVDPGSPAAKAGIHVEDILLEINGKAIETAMGAQEILKSADLRVGDKLPLKIFRKGRAMDITLTLVALPQEGQGAG